MSQTQQASAPTVPPPLHLGLTCMPISLLYSLLAIYLDKGRFFDPEVGIPPRSSFYLMTFPRNLDVTSAGNVATSGIVTATSSASVASFNLFCSLVLVVGGTRMS